jgi:hypothetical protein
MLMHQLWLQANILYKREACYCINCVAYVIKVTMNTTTKMNIMKLCCQQVTLGMFWVDEEFLKVHRRKADKSIIMQFISGYGHEKQHYI